VIDLSSLETEDLLRRAENGDNGAIGPILEQHRGRLNRMIAARLDRRIAARLDASDVVPEALGKASQRLPEYLRERPVRFYSWLTINCEVYRSPSTTCVPRDTAERQPCRYL
jgi:RNA polymerase sigma-70 factor (ECF subfamily)